jgi:hypothetical protein
MSLTSYRTALSRIKVGTLVKRARIQATTPCKGEHTAQSTTLSRVASRNTPMHMGKDEMPNYGTRARSSCYAGNRNRTCDISITNAALCQLSYSGVRYRYKVFLARLPHTPIVDPEESVDSTLVDRHTSVRVCIH